MYEVLSMRSDTKAEFLNKAGNSIRLKIIGSNYRKNALFFIFFFKRILIRKKPNAIIFRYLNDHENIVRSLFLAFNVIACLCLCTLFKVKVFWILHNVDKETHEYYPTIIKYLRSLIGNKANVIFVTDPLLIAIAKEYYPQWSSKIDFITFGKKEPNPNNKTITDNELLKTLKDFDVNKTDKDFVLFCPTTAGDKYTHLHFAESLISKAHASGLNYMIVIVGNLKSYLISNPKLSLQLRRNKNIILFDSYTSYNPNDIAPYIDFYWRSLSDQSVSFTLYEAASVNKPLLTLNEGFMALAVNEYGMGAVVSLDMNNIIEAHEKLENWDKNYASSFLDNHSWEIAAGKIVENLND